ncbi:MAG TPA: PqiC family protein, partial [Geminicoccaceae bacterium]|nr:PqiC family protein [Geminicoccaceae bacterium]
MSGATPRRRLLSGAAALLPALAACTRTRPTMFYTLVTAAGPPRVKRPGKGLVVGLGPITLPQYLDRPDIVTREGANQMRLAEFHQWAQPLEPMLTQIMAEDLLVLLGAEDVIPVPQRRDVPLDQVVEADVNRFEADEAGEVVLDARWRVYRGDDDTLTTSGRSLITEQGAPVPDYDAIVAAMSRAVGQLSAEIAFAIAGGAPVPA